MLLSYLLWVSSQHLLGHHSIKRPKPKFFRVSNGTKTHYNAEHSFAFQSVSRCSRPAISIAFCMPTYAERLVSHSLSSLYTPTLCRVFANEILKGTVKSRHRESKPIASPVRVNRRQLQGCSGREGDREKRRKGGQLGNKRYTDLWSLSVHREQRRGWERYWL